MADVPSSPAEFFTSFVPGKVEAFKDAMTGKTSAGAMTFRVVDAGEWSFRVTEGALVVTAGGADDALLQITIPQEDFVPIFVAGARALEERDVKPDAQVFAFKVLGIAADRAKLVRSIPGTLGFFIQDGDSTRKLFVTPGSQAPKLEAPDCKLECGLYIDLFICF